MFGRHMAAAHRKEQSICLQIAEGWLTNEGFTLWVMSDLSREVDSNLTVGRTINKWGCQAYGRGHPHPTHALDWLGRGWMTCWGCDGGLHLGWEFSQMTFGSFRPDDSTVCDLATVCQYTEWLGHRPRFSGWVRPGSTPGQNEIPSFHCTNHESSLVPQKIWWLIFLLT